MSGQERIPLKGEFNCWSGGFDLPDLLLAVCNTGHSGLLRFESAEGEKTLFLRKGEVVFASSSSADDRLGEYLLRAGKITLRDFSQHTHLVQPGKRLGTLLVESGVLDPKGLVQAVIGQVRAIVLSLFRWTEAQYGFDEQELPSKETITLDMPAARLIMDGLRRIDSWRRISQGVGAIDSIYRRVNGNEKTLRKLNLDTSTLEVLAILSQARTVQEICDSSPLPDIDVCRFLWAFKCLGWVEQPVEEPVASAKPRFQSEVPEGESRAPDGDSDGPATSWAPPDEDGAGPSADPEETVVLGAARFPLDESAGKDKAGGTTDDAPASASLADLEDTKIELVSGDSSKLAKPSAWRNGAVQPEPFQKIPDVAAKPVGFEEELSLVAPDSDSPDPTLSPEPQHDVPTQKVTSPDESALDTDDADLEGLGMVLGEEKSESEAG